MELAEVSADEEVGGLGVAANVDIGSGAGADTAVVAEGDGGTRAGLKEEESLDAEEEVACVVGGGGGVGGIELDGVGEGLREDLEHEAGVDGEPGGLNEGGLVRDAGGGGGGEEDALLELR